MTTYTTATTFLEHASSNSFITYHVPTNSPASSEEEPIPLLNQPDHALSSSTFHPSEESNSGFILSRIIEDGYTLELRWIGFSRASSSSVASSSSLRGKEVGGNKFKELDQQGTLPPVRFVFPSRLIPTPSFNLIIDSSSISTTTPTIQVLVLTESGYLYNLNFNNENLFYSTSLSSEENKWSEEYKVNSLDGRLPILMHGVGTGKVIVGCSDGFGVVIEIDEESELTLHETELKSSSSFSVRSLVSSFSTRSLASTSNSALSNFSSPLQLLSIASLPLSDNLIPFAFGITRDRKLKVWNLTTGTCLKAIDLPRSFASSSNNINTMEIDYSRGTDSPSTSKRNNSKSPSSLLPPSPQTLIKLITGPENSPFLYYLILFIPSSTGYSSAFSIFGITLDNSGSVSEITPVTERVCLTSSASLVDFNVSNFGPNSSQIVLEGQEGEENWTLWTNWEEAGESEIKFIELPELLDGGVVTNPEEELEWTSIERGSAALSSLWTADYFDEILKDSNQSVKDIFIQHIFFPARYPPATLDYALAVYEDGLNEEFDVYERPEVLSIEFDSTFDRISAVVGCLIQLETSNQTGAVLYDLYNKKLKGEWLRFVAILNESRAAALFPIALSMCKGNQVAMIIMRDAISVPIVQDTVSTITSRFSSTTTEDLENIQTFLALPEEILEVSYPYLAPLDIRHDILAILKIISTLKSSFNSLANTQIDLELNSKLVAIAKNRIPFNVNIDDIAGDFYDKVLEPFISNDLQESLSELLRQVRTPIESFQAVWNLLTTNELVNSTTTSSFPTSTFTKPSDLTSALLADSLSSTIETRYKLAKDFFILLCYIKAEEDGFISEISAIANAAFSTLHTYTSLRWMIQQTASPVLSNSTTDDSILQRFGEMKVSTIDDSLTPSFSLLSGLLRDIYSPTLSPISLSQSLILASIHFLSSLGLIRQKLSIIDSESDVSFGLRLYELALPELALEFVDKFPQSAGLLYVRGLALLDLDRSDEAQLDLSRAAAAFYSDEDEDEERLDEGSGIFHILPQEISGSLARYYRYIVSLFVAKDIYTSVVHFSTLAIDAFADEKIEDENILKDLWLQLFRSNASLALYEDAYNTMMATPFRDTKNASLAHLISVLCENGKFSLLTQFSFVGLQAELERDLAFRARNSDPLASTNYYQILYAYHMSKGDYRSAGSIMFSQSRRIGEMSGRGGSFKDVATLQCQSYLAAINALSLVESTHAWVAVYVDDDSGERITKKRKLHYHIPEVEYESTSKAAEIIELVDIRREYAVALSRLQLCSDFPELERTNFTLDSDAIVSLFSQIGNFDSAFIAARTLEVDMSSLFETLTEKCVGLASNITSSEDASWVALNDEAATWESSLASKAWKLLQRHLDRQDNDSLKYRLVVLEKTLAIDQDGKVPSWLIDSFLAKDSPMLIRTMIKFDRLNDAFRYALAILKTTTLPTSPASTYLPYSLFDQLLALDRDSQSLTSNVLLSFQTQLRSAIEERLELANKAMRSTIRAAR